VLDEDAVLARTSVDRARTGLLTTYARHPSASSSTVVAVTAREDGGVEVRLSPAALGARQLLARPVATLRVAPAWCEPVLLHGAARRLPGTRGQGELVFSLRVAAVRVGSPAVLLDEASWSAAAPDPLRHDAPAVLSHLNEAHADALAACLRAGGSPAGFASATRLDARGLTAVTVGPEGVDTVRLRFPAPVTSLHDLPPSLSWVLDPACRCCRSRRSTGASG
jgi:Protein of unknown function (DUF2470)